MQTTIMGMKHGMVGSMITFLLIFFLFRPCLLFYYIICSFTFCVFHFFSTILFALLPFASFTTRSTLNDIVPLTVFVPQSFETRGPSLLASCLENHLLPSNLSNDFSNLSRSGFDTDDFYARDVVRQTCSVCF
jgi:hypothetical protein